MAKNHELALRDYILGEKLDDIARKYNVSTNTVKSWRKRHNWSRDRTAKKSAPIAPQNKNGCTPKKTAPEPEVELTDQERLFCYHYVRTWNAMQAAMLSGYSQNKVCAKVQGCRLKQRPHIKQEIDRLASLFREDIHLDILDLLSFCMKIIGADIGDYLRFGAVEKLVFDADGPIKDPDTGEYLKEPVNMVTLGESEQLDTSVIQEVKQGKDGISIKLADKKWAWEQLIKYFDWLPDKWQRKVEEDKLEVERKKLAILEAKAGGGGSSEDRVQIIDDMAGESNDTG